MNKTALAVEPVADGSVSPSGRLAILRYWGPVAAYAGFIFYLSSQSFFPDTLPTVIQQLGDKVHHMMAYGVFSLLWYRAFRCSAGRWAASHAVWLAVAGATLYGVTDEWHQSFVPLREADPLDVVADAAGAALAALGIDRWSARWRLWPRVVKT